MNRKNIKRLITLLIVIGVVIYLIIEPLYTPTAIQASASQQHFPKITANKSLVSDSYIANSFEAITESLTSHVDGIALNVRLSKDKIPFIFYDDNFTKLTDGDGVLEHQNWRAIKLFKYQGLSDSHILSLEEVFKLVGSQKYLFLDIKDHVLFNKEFVNIICNLIHEYNLEDSVIVESSNPIFLSLMRLNSRDIMLKYNFTTATADVADTSWLLKNKFLQKQIRRIVRPDILGINGEVDQQYLISLIEHEYPIIVGDIDNINVATELFRVGVKGIKTNVPAKLISAISFDNQKVLDAGGSSSIIKKVIHVNNEQDIIAAYELAKKSGSKITIAGRRHSMG
ncbi:MAG: hypothetical protein HRU35_07100 [Rickettsiaceae bacterium]|nr:hypothetical protein [Rickettsiaceae bacterium]